MHDEGLGISTTAGRTEYSAESLQALVHLVRARLGQDVAWFSAVRDGAQVFEIIDGNAEALGLDYDARQTLTAACCRQVIEGQLPKLVQCPAVSSEADAGCRAHTVALGAYVAVPILDHDGRVQGTLSAASRQPRPRLSDIDLRLTRQVADLIGTLLGCPDSIHPASADERAVIREMVARGDFEVVFQSVHHVTSGAVDKIEALARFACPPFRPDAVIAQATQIGLGVELELAILRRALAMLPQLPDDLALAVNISPSAVLVAPWPELLADVDPARIVLELTEHDAVEDYDALDEALHVCRQRGVRIAVDDVGAGFSTFSHVLELSPDFVKLDQSITRHIDVDDARRRLAHAITEFAEQLGATVIAEGVETQGELDAAAAVGITAAQGYYLSRPRPVTAQFPTAAATAEVTDRVPTGLDVLADRRFELALAHSPIGMAVVGPDGTFMRTNRALRTMLGYSKRELEALTFQEITHPDDLDADLALLTECLQGRRRSYRIDKRYITANGRTVWGALTVVSVHAPRDRPQYFVSQIVDMTAERIREADLTRQAATDPLTGLANRHAGWRRLEELDASSAGYGVLFCDIERFKAVNDRHGHRAGDHLLIAVANCLRTATADAGLVVRWGGDEFLVITHSGDESELARLADRLTGQLHNTPVMLDNGVEVPVRLTVGSAVHRPGDSSSIDVVLDHADHAMYDKRRHRSGTARS
ncbi:diguanylate phosphodiesterase [Mycolicibacterium litorale]|nr:diguanylate phosphodiesterase [Mycolicibacterium litorale]